MLLLKPISLELSVNPDRNACNDEQHVFWTKTHVNFVLVHRSVVHQVLDHSFGMNRPSGNIEAEVHDRDVLFKAVQTQNCIFV
jgi:hypothetical protein